MHRTKEYCMSNESNREDRRSISPSELQASDFFPPGTGWNKDESRERKQPGRALPEDEEAVVDGRRPH
jgi:hypothetical protein